MADSDVQMLALKGRQGSEHLADLLFGQTQFVEFLQVEPEFRTGAEEVSQAQGCIASPQFFARNGCPHSKMTKMSSSCHRPVIYPAYIAFHLPIGIRRQTLSR